LSLLKFNWAEGLEVGAGVIVRVIFRVGVSLAVGVAIEVGVTVGFLVGDGEAILTVGITVGIDSASSLFFGVGMGATSVIWVGTEGLLILNIKIMPNTDKISNIIVNTIYFFESIINNTLLMKILAIETSCDDTCAAVLENDRLLSNVISSQTDLHAKWGGVVPDIAKRAHTERIEVVIIEALKRSKPSGPKIRTTSLDREALLKFLLKDIDVIAVTLGPGLAIALGVGVNKAKELAIKYNKKLIEVNHVEGHILANLIKNKLGKPERKIEFPALAMTVSGGHTKIILIQNPPCPPLTKGGLNLKYTVVGETLDDAAGEALDKAAKMMGLGYPGGPILERLAEKGDKKYLILPRPLSTQKNFDYSFSGLKTSFYYQIKDWPKEKIGQNLANLSATFQDAVFDSLLIKFKKAIEFYNPKTLLACGGVMANLEIRKRLRKMAKEFNIPLLMPVKKQFNTDNAAMIGIVGYYKALRGEFVEDIESLDRNPRLEI